jgi:deoxyribonuclease IV
MRIGSHLSIAGGLHRALEAAAGYGMDCAGLFVRNQVQWRARPLAPEQIRTFRSVRKRRNIAPIVAHGSYLINLAGDREIRKKSIDAMVEDLTRCGLLGIEYLVFHPGAHDDADRGTALVAQALNEIFTRCRKIRPKILLETTAGQGRSLGWTFEQLAAIIDGVDRQRRVGICLDTCHVFAAGYDLRTARACRDTLSKLEDAVGLDGLRAIHLNDSKRDLGSRVDRHEHIGLGAIGLKGFAALVTDRRLDDIPMILETPKRKHPSGRDWDEVNLETIRSLVK